MNPRFGYGVVLLLIVGTYVLALFAERRWLVTVLLAVQSATAWQSLRVARAHRGLRMTGAVVFLLALAVATVNAVSHGRALTGVAFSAASMLYLLAPIAIVRDLARRERVDGQTMLGALAAYLLIGMAFGFAYQCVAAFQPGPLFGEQGDATLADALFFSFVTVTTTGYGNLVPASNPGQTIAVLEALIGQLFLVTAVAKVVENWRPRNWKRDSSTGDDATEREVR
ncbi:ion channel [Actinoplanes oblitus]|uniref:Ion channel n=1 Tax=Actinoplanes oblitus TaxID=3040509 RepID=A0ABY8WQ31_9ACTN|nr:potassium channel family protein [Actinoplanes oblitus]WIM98429.1 ion channel [Actinoplanes oblitus]